MKTKNSQSQQPPQTSLSTLTWKPYHLILGEWQGIHKGGGRVLQKSEQGKEKQR